MSGSTSRTIALNPSAIISLIEKHHKQGRLIHEVYIRRAISALYFTLFNYWAAKKYDAGDRGRGPCQDQWPLKEFNQEMLCKGLDPQIIILYLYRVAADHYTLNPTTVELWDFRQRRRRCFINTNALQRAIECAKELYKAL